MDDEDYFVNEETESDTENDNEYFSDGEVGSQSKSAQIDKVYRSNMEKIKFRRANGDPENIE
jgi:hypothetical protein